MKPSEDATRLARRLAALPEPAMRQTVLLEYLQRTRLEAAVAVLNDIHRLGRGGGPPFNLALLALAEALTSPQFLYEHQAGLYEAAKTAGLNSLARLFLSDATDRPSETDEDLGRDDRRELTLGHRKWMARSSDRMVLQRLLRDPEPEVIPILLQNPKVVERDVVLLAARRPARVDVQRAIYASSRWICRYAVKRALVLNPFTPTDLSVRLLGFLSRRDIQLVCRSTGISSAVREAAHLLQSQG